MKVSIGVLALFATLGCSQDGRRALVEQGVAVSITAVNPLPPSPLPAWWGPDAGGGSRTFELYGSFPDAAGMTYRPNVICDGKTWPAVVLWGYGTSQMNVSIPNVEARCVNGDNAGVSCSSDAQCPNGNCLSEFPSGTSCWFSLERSYFNYRLHPTVAFSNLFGPVSTARITAGVNSSFLAREIRYTLTGTIPPNVTPLVSCDEVTIASYVVSSGVNQVQIGFATPSASKTCSIQLKQGNTVVSNTWVVRFGSAPPTLTSTGLYDYGGYQPNANRIASPSPPVYTTISNPTEALQQGAAVIANAGYRNVIRFVMVPGMRLVGNNLARGAGALAESPPMIYGTDSVNLGTGNDANLYSMTSFCRPYPTDYRSCTTSTDCHADEICLFDWTYNALPGVRMCRKPFLACAAASPQYQAAFNQVNDGATIFVTAFDESTAGIAGGYAFGIDNIKMALEPSSAQRQLDIKEEYRRLTLALYQTQQNTNRTFVIGTWETDNGLFGGKSAEYYEQKINSPVSCTNVCKCYAAAGQSCPHGRPPPLPPPPVPLEDKVWSCEINTGVQRSCVTTYNNEAHLTSRALALKKWTELRRDGIAQGRQEAAALGYTNAHVLDGIEIVHVKGVDDPRFLRSVLNDVVAPVAPAYVTYSAWGSSAPGRLDEDLAYLKGRVAGMSSSAMTGAKPYLAIGELGIGTVAATPAHRWRLRELAKAAYRANVPRFQASPGPAPAILWLAFMQAGWNWNQGFNVNNPPWWTAQPDYGATVANLLLKALPMSYNDERFFDANGVEKQHSVELRNELVSYASTGVLPPQPTMITAIADFGLDNSTPRKHIFWLGGTFPAGTYTATVICDGTARPATLSPGPDGTLVVSIVGPLGPNGQPIDVYCTFAVNNNQAGQLGSPLFGPRHVCPGIGNSGQTWYGACLP